MASVGGRGGGVKMPGEHGVSSEVKRWRECGQIEGGGGGGGGGGRERRERLRGKGVEKGWKKEED